MIKYIREHSDKFLDGSLEFYITRYKERMHYLEVDIVQTHAYIQECNKQLENNQMTATDIEACTKKMRIVTDDVASLNEFRRMFIKERFIADLRFLVMQKLKLSALSPYIVDSVAIKYQEALMLAEFFDNSEKTLDYLKFSTNVDRFVDKYAELYIKEVEVQNKGPLVLEKQFL